MIGFSEDRKVEDVDCEKNSDTWSLLIAKKSEMAVLLLSLVVIIITAIFSLQPVETKKSLPATIIEKKEKIFRPYEDEKKVYKLCLKG